MMENTLNQNNKINILCLEDCQKDFEIIKENLLNSDVEADFTVTDKETIFTELITAQHYDVIISDYNLGAFDAVQALELCNTICPDVPFICVSGTVGEIKATELLRLGAVDYLLKDRLERLPFAIRRAIDDARAEREKAVMEAAMIESEKKYRSIFENIQDVYYQTDLDGTVYTISPSLYKFTGMHPEEVIGKSITYLYYDIRDRQAMLSQLKAHGELMDYEIRVKVKNDEIRYASLNARLMYNEAGEPEYLEGTFRDITKRMLAEQAIQQSEEKFRNLFEKDAAVKYIFDPVTKDIIDVNLAATKFYGWSKEEMREMKISDVNVADPSQTNSTIGTVMTHNNLRLELKHRTKDGAIKDVEKILFKRKMLKKD